MNGGSKFLASAAVLALAGCGGSQAKLQIRATPAPLSAMAKPVPFRIAEANGHLALGNVALALESYRKALREQPESVEAMIGLAACYDRMARFDLSRRYYEAALAVVPADTSVLNAFARSLDLQGHSDEAAAVRREIGVRLAAAKPSPKPAIQASARPVDLVHAPAPAAGPSVTVALPAPRPITSAPAKVAAVHPKPTPVRQVAAVPAPIPKPVALAPATAPLVAAKPKPLRQVVAAPAPKPIAVASLLAPTMAAKPKPVRQATAVPNSVPVTGPSVTVALAPPKTVATPLVVPAATRAPAASAPVAAAPAAAPLPAAAPFAAPSKMVDPVAAPLPPAPAPVAIARSAPLEVLPSLKAPTRLERLSPGEVVLVTTGKPQWRSQVVGRTALSTTIRYVPLRTAQVRPVQIRLLNAARHQGLAARTRNLLADRGWRRMAIGDANRVRQTSLILYPPNRRGTAVRLGAQFGIPIAKRASGNEFVMLIGRDLAKRTAPRARG